jgi:ubiquinol-cytochrome c reductase cytochrome b subunit
MAGRKKEIIEILLNARWGGQALICLYVSILSGIVLALQYSPAEPFYSSATLELIVP